MKMKSIIALCAVLINLIAYSAEAVGVNTSRSNIKNYAISLDSGVWCYSVFERGDPKAPIRIIEVQSSIDNQCEGESLKQVPLAKEVLVEVLNSKRQKLAGEELEVLPLSAIQLSSISDGSTNQWPLMRMKKGVVKFFNETKGRYASDPYAEDTVRFFLDLPSELRSVVDESFKGASRVIIILREIQEGKKGLNAVNVKKA